MAKFNQFVSDLSTTGKGVNNTYDDSEEREVFIKEFNQLWPKWSIVANDKICPCDLSAYNECGNLMAFIELDRGGTDWNKMYWGYASVLERKQDSMLLCNNIAPVIMLWTNKSMSKYVILNLRDVNVLDFPLQEISYKKKRNKTTFIHPFDFHRRIPLKYGTLRTTGEYNEKSYIHSSI